MGCVRRPNKHCARSVALFFLLLLYERSCESANVPQMSYFKLQGCSGQSCGVPEPFQNSSGVLSCARRCKTDESCIAFSVGQNRNQDGGNATGECKVHRACGSSPCDTGGVQQAWTLVASTNGTSDASEVNTSPTPKNLTCQNSGVWSSEEQRCICVNGWVDPECDRLAESCAELITHGAGSYDDRHHTVQLHPPTSAAPFTAVCRLWLNREPYKADTFLFKSNGTHDFNKPWSEYEFGFYFDKQNTWLGLAHIHALCQIPERDNVGLEVTFRYAHDKRKTLTFSVGDSSTNYTLSVGSSCLGRWGLTSSVFGEDYTGECLALSNGLPFSTYDAENCPCAESKNCASRAKAGWWHSGCDLPCNPLGAAYENLPQELAEDRIRIPELNFHNSSYAKNFTRIQLFFTYVIP